MTMIETIDDDRDIQREDHPAIQVFSEIAIHEPDCPEAVEWPGLPRRSWPPAVHRIETAWVRPGDPVVVTLINPNSDYRQYEVSWGRRDPTSGDFVSTNLTQGVNFARSCAIRFREVRMVCDADGNTGEPNPQLVTFKSLSTGFLAGEWLPQEAGFPHPCAFRLVMVPAGADLQPYCRYEPLFLPLALMEDWLNPAVPTRRFLKPAGRLTFKVLDVASGSEARCA